MKGRPISGLPHKDAKRAYSSVCMDVCAWNPNAGEVERGGLQREWAAGQWETILKEGNSTGVTSLADLWLPHAQLQTYIYTNMGMHKRNIQ